MKLINVADTAYLMKCLVYGNFGVGKTRFGGTAAMHPDMRDVLFVTVEDGTLTIKQTTAFRTPMITSIREMEEVFWSLANKKTGFETIKTVVIDSGTDLVQLCVEEVVRDNCKTNKGKDPDRVTIRDWGDVNFILTKLFRMFRDLPMNVIMTALVREQYDTDDAEAKMRRGPVMCGPDFPPKLMMRTMAFFDHVWSIHRKPNGTRVLMTQPNGPWVAKTRGERFAEALGPSVENPELPQLLELLKKTTQQQQGE